MTLSLTAASVRGGSADTDEGIWRLPEALLREFPILARTNGVHELHPLLHPRYFDYLRTTRGITPFKAGVPGSHSELVALNKALRAREACLGRPAVDEDLAELFLNNVHLKGSLKGVGTPPYCPNCEGLVPTRVKFVEDLE